MCKKQTSVLHSSTASEVISLDAGVGMDGIPALDSWYSVIVVLHSSSSQVQGNLNRAKQSRKHTSNQTKIQTKRDDLVLVHVDYVASNAKPSRTGAMLYIS